MVSDRWADDNERRGRDEKPDGEPQGESTDERIGRSRDRGNRYMVEIAAEAVFFFNQVYSGIRLTVGPEQAVEVATALTASIVRSFTILGDGDVSEGGDLPDDFEDDS